MCIWIQSKIDIRALRVAFLKNCHGKTLCHGTIDYLNIEPQITLRLG